MKHESDLVRQAARSFITTLNNTDLDKLNPLLLNSIIVILTDLNAILALKDPKVIHHRNLASLNKTPHTS